MQAGISSNEWVKSAADWLRQPITQGLLFSLSLHLAFLLIFQPATGSGGRHTVVIDAQLLPAKAEVAASDPVEQVEQAPALAEAEQETPLQSETKPVPELLTAMKPSLTPPIPALPRPEQEQAVKSEALPESIATPLTEAVTRAETPVDMTVPSGKASGSAQISALPSLPIDIDTTWYQAREVDQHPKAIGAVEPVYPEEAKRRNLEGTLKLMLKIDPLGRVLSAEVVEATPPDVFNEAALAAFREARFHPAIRDGRPVRYQAYMRVEFRLRD